MLFLAASPIIDGVLISVLTSNIVQDLRIALVFGLTVFSGAGCISVGVLLRDKVATITKVYIIVCILAVLTSIVSPLLTNLLFPYFYLFTALILISLGMELIGINPEIKPLTILKIGLLISVLYIVSNYSVINTGLKINYAALSFVIISVCIGYVVTLLGSLILNSRVNLTTLRIFAGLCLILLGIKIIGVPVPSNLIIIFYGIGIVISMKSQK